MPAPAADLTGKVIVVTGATSGIGEVTALELARSGATVVIVCRSAARGEEARAGIHREVPGGRVELAVADFAALADVRRAAAEILSRWDRLDVLVNNAGAIQMDRTTTADGIETTFGVNHLAPFLLTNLLIDRLKASAPSRIVNVSSRAHLRFPLDFADLQGERRYSGWVAYSRSKLCNVLFTYELARKLEGTGVTVNCLHPGVVATGFGRNRPGLFKLGVRLVAPFMWTKEKGAQASIRLARSPEVVGVTGRYFDEHGREARSSRASHDREAQRRLWEISARMTGLEGA